MESHKQPDISNEPEINNNNNNGTTPTQPTKYNDVIQPPDQQLVPNSTTPKLPKVNDIVKFKARDEEQWTTANVFRRGGKAIWKACIMIQCRKLRRWF